MKEKQDSEKLIGKMIKKRKEENKAFIKILNALDPKPSSGDADSKNNSKINKPKLYEWTDVSQA